MISTSDSILYNYLSGDSDPGPRDVDLTRRLAGAGAVIGIDVWDRLVLGDARSCRFKE